METPFVSHPVPHDITVEAWASSIAETAAKMLPDIDQLAQTLQLLTKDDLHVTIDVACFFVSDAMKGAFAPFARYASREFKARAAAIVSEARIRRVPPGPSDGESVLSLSVCEDNGRNWGANWPIVAMGKSRIVQFGPNKFRDVSQTVGGEAVDMIDVDRGEMH